MEEKKKISFGKIISFILLVIVIAFCINAGCILYYLNNYGYGVKELPQTLSVYFKLSDGFTVKESKDGTSYFISGENFMSECDELLEKHGYEKVDMKSSVLYFSKQGSESEKHDFSIKGTDDDCYWFRVYKIDNDYKIEKILNK